MRHLIPILGGALAASACAPVSPPADHVPPPRASTGSCSAAPAQTLVGETATSEIGARALSLSGAVRLRWGPPDSAFTMDYREDRVNVFYDRGMIVTKVTCG